MKYMKAFLKTLKLLCIGIVVIFVAVLWRLDVSNSPLHIKTHPDAFHKQFQQRPPVVLVTYADGPSVFFKNQHALLASAADKGFDHIYAFKRSHIDPGFYQRHQKILSQETGAGYWLWKPYFILKVMEQLPEGSLIFYADSGIVFRDNIHKLIEKLQEVSLILVGHGTPAPLKRHLKKEAYPFFRVPLTETILNDENIWAFFIGIKNTEKNREFIKQWLAVCVQPEAIMNEPFDSKNQDPEFSYHQHDQSLLSVIAALRKEDKIVYRRHLFRKEFGITNFHRHPREEFTSPLLESAGVPRWLANVLWNNTIFQWIRKKLN